MATITFGNLRAEMEALADLPVCTSATHVTLVQANAWLNKAWYRYQRMLAECGAGYIAHTVGSENVMTGATANIALPTDFGMLVSVERKLSDAEWVEVPKLHQANAVRERASATIARGYLLQGANLTLYPKPTASTYRIRYIAAPAEITSDATTVDDYYGWSQIIPLEAAIKAMQRKEADWSGLAALLDKTEKDMDAFRVNRSNLHAPSQVRDVEGDMFGGDIDLRWEGE